MRQRLGDAGGLSDFGVNLIRLPPGNWSSQRHWHSHEDEFVYVLNGEVTLIEDGGDGFHLSLNTHVTPVLICGARHAVRK